MLNQVTRDLADDLDVADAAASPSEAGASIPKRIDPDTMATPQHLYDDWSQHLRFNLDGCALPHNTKCKNFIAPPHGLEPWSDPASVKAFINPPYSDIPAWFGHAVVARCRSGDAGAERPDDRMVS